MRQIVLASASPRRKGLLEQMGLEFTVVPSDFEEYLDSSRPVQDIAAELGLGKARAVAEQYSDAIVIGGDTIVTTSQGEQLGKPEGVEDARRMWRLNSAGPSKVTTSVAVICKAENYEKALVDSGFVYFKPYDAAKVEAYLATGDYKDKAGAYAIFNTRDMIEHIDGDEETIIGLSTTLLRDLLRPFGAVPHKEKATGRQYNGSDE